MKPFSLACPQGTLSRRKLLVRRQKHATGIFSTALRCGPVGLSVAYGGSELGIWFGPISDLKTGLVGDLNLRNQKVTTLKSLGSVMFVCFLLFLGMFFSLMYSTSFYSKMKYSIVCPCMFGCHEVTKYSSCWWRVVLGSLFVW